MKKLKTFTLDYSKWRSGGQEEEKYAVGTGITSLLNSDGYMCCLGQMCQQVGIEDICGYESPALLPQNKVPLLKYDGDKHTRFALKCMDINDADTISPAQRIVLLKKEFENKGIRFILKNAPNEVRQEIRKLSRKKTLN